MASNLYDLLGVAPSASADELHAAYRKRAREVHPDAVGGAHQPMAELNAAWSVLSDPETRRGYDRTLAPESRARTRPTRPNSAGAASRPASTISAAGPSTIGARREAWLGGLRVQILRLGRQAGRSASMSLSLSSDGRTRSLYEDDLEVILDHLAIDTGPRIREARSLGAAPLDLGVIAALVGLASYSTELRRQLEDGQFTDADMRRAQLVDRMWDVMAHEVPHDISGELGGNPKLTRAIRSGQPRIRRRIRDRLR